MNEGHPYWTKELDLQRAKQRRLLRTVPEDFLNLLVKGLPDGTVKDDDKGIAEAELRRLADLECESLAGFFERYDGMEAAQSLQQLFTAVRAPLTIPRSDLFTDLRRSVESRTRADTSINMEKNEHEALIRFISLLVWADDVADDYTDKRIRRD
jgi:hypothetical protein